MILRKELKVSFEKIGEIWNNYFQWSFSNTLSNKELGKRLVEESFDVDNIYLKENKNV